MNDGISNRESNESDDFSSSSDEIRINPQQIQKIENIFDDIDDFWSNTKATPRLSSVSIGNSVNSPRITFPAKSPNNQTLYQPTPPRTSQKSINKFCNSPIYVGTSTEDTPYRYNSKEDSVSSDNYSGNEDSSSSDDITFVDTPITDKSKPKPFNNAKDIFKLSPITSNKNESSKENDSIENNYIDSSSNESEISVLHANSNEQKKQNLNSLSNNEIVNESNNDSNFPIPPFSFSNSSDSESNKDQNNDTHISQNRNNNEKDFNMSLSKKDSHKKNKSNSKPAFASPKRISSGLKEETIITELSPFASSRRNKIESRRMPNFRLSQIDDDDNDVEKINQQEIIQESFFYRKEEDNKKTDNEVSKSVQSGFLIDDNQKEFSDDNDSDDIKKIEKLAKKDPLHKKKMDDLISDYNLSKKEQSKSPSKKEIKFNDETESKPKTEPRTRKTKSALESKNNQQKSNSEPKSKNKSKLKSEEDAENESKPDKNQSKEKAKQKQKSSIKSNSQPPKTKQKSKADSKSKSPTKSNSQPSKPRIQKASKLHYDFNDLSDDSDDEERMSNLIQIPNQKKEKSSKDDSIINDNNDDLPIALRRRKRVIVKPLKFWCGEHIVYGLSEDGFQTFQNVSIPEKLKKLKKGENRVMPKDQKRIPAKDDCERKLTRVEGSGLVVFNEKVVDFDKSNEVILKKGEKCNVACKGDSPLIFKIE